ncbi:CpaD family pilus assembly protein (plasmid) [Xanthobacter dioxanivorans]|uniref:CpaD family pilus assembly protein n=1 Tax=Xanthobacter dioxanivorans TaxID=2528964 RepID=A0A974PV44_9HYPH|nr:CpaD family pilus assembly protein [Xanthobacter dioxanivorans]QRG10275.1 CpaD family pilus assembly protein [Xanthobacter dioxanivorans]
MFQIRKFHGLLAVAMLAFTAAGCSSDPYWTEPTYPLDYRQRHPIELADERQVLEVFPRSAHQLDARQAADVRAFARSYQVKGKSILQIIAPTELVPGQTKELVNPYVRHTLEAVRQTLIGSGVPRQNIHIKYLLGSGGETPLRLAFMTMVARVTHECGKWPFDLAAGNGTEGWQNEPYWNFGCAYQANLAGQVADPLDLVRPRQETPGDLVRRVGDIEQVRDGKDPSTAWPTNSGSSGQQGSQGGTQ